MFEIIPQPKTKYSLEYYATDPIFSGPVTNLKQIVASIGSQLQGRTIWMINSTARGGGVAEMMPGLTALMNDLGIDVRWGVINSNDPAFFKLTKRLHNLIHGDDSSGDTFSEDEVMLYERVNRQNAEDFKKEIKKEDILIIHDPQPMCFGQIIAEECGVTAFWRCHIGLDTNNQATQAAWSFLKRYASAYAHSIFTAPEYVPDYFMGNYSIIHPCIDPLSHKNQELNVTKLTGILCNSGLMPYYEPIATPDFTSRIKKIQPDGSTGEPGEIGLMFRPCITQISRWDRLKGWLPLLEGFIKFKEENAYTNGRKKNSRRQKRHEYSRLVLGGSDPTAVADDPEGIEVLNEVKSRYMSIEDKLKKDIAILLLPMKSAKENSLIVNAIQRCSTIMVQNSLQEGFGLTATEAMWKRKPVMTSSACGLRQQVRNNVDGLMVKNPENPKEISSCLHTLVGNPRKAYNLGRSAQRRVYDNFLIFNQISDYLELIGRFL